MNEGFKRVKHEYLIILVTISTELHKYKFIACCISGIITKSIVAYIFIRKIVAIM